MTRILFLDDDAIRHDTFAKRYADKAECVHVETFDEFERVLRGSKFDIIFLDHDLNDFGARSVVQYVFGTYQSSETCEMTGTDAADLVAHLPPEKLPAQVIIHSHNPAGAERMEMILRDVDVFVVRDPFKGRQSGPKNEDGSRSAVEV